MFARANCLVDEYVQFIRTQVIIFIAVTDMHGQRQKWWFETLWSQVPPHVVGALQTRSLIVPSVQSGVFSFGRRLLGMRRVGEQRSRPRLHAKERVIARFLLCAQLLLMYVYHRFANIEREMARD